MKEFINLGLAVYLCGRQPGRRRPVLSRVAWEAPACGRRASRLRGGVRSAGRRSPAQTTGVRSHPMLRRGRGAAQEGGTLSWGGSSRHRPPPKSRKHAPSGMENHATRSALNSPPGGSRRGCPRRARLGLPPRILLSLSPRGRGTPRTPRRPTARVTATLWSCSGRSCWRCTVGGPCSALRDSCVTEVCGHSAGAGQQALAWT